MFISGPLCTIDVLDRNDETWPFVKKTETDASSETYLLRKVTTRMSGATYLLRKVTARMNGATYLLRKVTTRASSATYLLRKVIAGASSSGSATCFASNKKKHQVQVVQHDLSLLFALVQEVQSAYALFF